LPLTFIVSEKNCRSPPSSAGVKSVGQGAEVTVIKMQSGITTYIHVLSLTNKSNFDLESVGSCFVSAYSRHNYNYSDTSANE
jgi:hypothetical protein